MTADGLLHEKIEDFLCPRNKEIPKEFLVPEMQSISWNL